MRKFKAKKHYQHNSSQQQQQQHAVTELDKIVALLGPDCKGGRWSDGLIMRVFHGHDAMPQHSTIRSSSNSSPFYRRHWTLRNGGQQALSSNLAKILECLQLLSSYNCRVDMVLEDPYYGDSEFDDPLQILDMAHERRLVQSLRLNMDPDLLTEATVAAARAVAAALDGNGGDDEVAALKKHHHHRQLLISKVAQQYILHNPNFQRLELIFPCPITTTAQNEEDEGEGPSPLYTRLVSQWLASLGAALHSSSGWHLREMILDMRQQLFYLSTNNNNYNANKKFLLPPPEWLEGIRLQHSLRVLDLANCSKPFLQTTLQSLLAGSASIASSLESFSVRWSWLDDEDGQQNEETNNPSFQLLLTFLSSPNCRFKHLELGESSMIGKYVSCVNGVTRRLDALLCSVPPTLETLIINENSSLMEPAVLSLDNFVRKRASTMNLRRLDIGEIYVSKPLMGSEQDKIRQWNQQAFQDMCHYVERIVQSKPGLYVHVRNLENAIQTQMCRDEEHSDKDDDDEVDDASNDNPQQEYVNPALICKLDYHGVASCLLMDHHSWPAKNLWPQIFARAQKVFGEDAAERRVFSAIFKLLQETTGYEGNAFSTLYNPQRRRKKKTKSAASHDKTGDDDVGYHQHHPIRRIKHHPLPAERQDSPLCIVRAAKSGRIFEVVCHQNAFFQYKHGKTKKLSTVLETRQVFRSVQNGEYAPDELLQSTFGSTNVLRVAELILARGHIHTHEQEH